MPLQAFLLSAWFVYYCFYFEYVVYLSYFKDFDRFYLFESVINLVFYACMKYFL